ncbi:biotin-dependent carboxyltransferase family protein [Methylobacterium mesophilicum SR1.6/6]|uniref:Biotin-dependent carboxyltransferase family protein n=1 Tax=Methylobacterium mesophilicum SR1.6/6 TaxID=908290 RepID=A0A6B9FKR0_9HYPH|nr:biotin-dependent carboxyltransferase family protein [Methylobacterium mesophilicum]QGY02529.1 biotin-dependent carboxyltransferase family protein [Methylobacterium mesophilicum SR1.6/6]
MGALVIEAAGPGVTLQDGGRHGYLRYGITAAGPMDPLMHATANRAAGNPLDAIAIEISTGGVTVAAEDGPLGIALVAPGFRIALDGATLPGAVALTLAPGQTLAVRAGDAGSWGYLAVCGRLDVTPVLGSTATHTRSALGGLDGRGLAAGDRLPVADDRPADGAPHRLVIPWLQRDARPIRVVLGPQDDYFAPDQIAAFLDGPWTVSPRGDRMACFLDGTPLAHARGHDIVSDGVAMGAIQVPGNGLPIVLMADRQSTGGYPKIATVIGADLGRLAQVRGGTHLRFRSVTVAEAVDARRAERDALREPVAREPVVRTDFASDFLLGLNLVGGVTDAHAWPSESAPGAPPQDRAGG